MESPIATIDSIIVRMAHPVSRMWDATRKFPVGVPSSVFATAAIVCSPSELILATGMLRDCPRSPEDDELRRAFTDQVREIAQQLMPGAAAGSDQPARPRAWCSR